MATKRLNGRIPLESARAGVEDDSLTDYTATNPRTDKTTRKEITAQTATSNTEKALQICPCGWKKITSVKGLKIHQGKKRCLVEGELGTRIDHYFLRSNSSQSSEVQRLESNQSSQDISPPVSEEGCTSTEKGYDDGVEPTQQQRPARERRQQQSKPRVNWPGAAEKAKWKTINEDLSSILENIKGTVEKKLDKMADIIYTYGAEKYGLLEKRQRSRVAVKQSRRQLEMQRLIKHRRQLKKQWRKASEHEKEGINVLQENIKRRLTSLRRAEKLRLVRKKKERARTNFFKDPFKFVKSLFTKKATGTLKTTKQSLEEHLEKMHSHPSRHKAAEVPPDIPPIEQPRHLMDVSPPKWKEVEATVRRARTSSAPGPNGVPYKVYKNTPDVLRFLWRLMRVAWVKQTIPKAWRRAGGVLIPKEEESTTISQFRPISLLNVEGKIFFSIVAQRVTRYLEENRLVDTTVQKAGLPGSSGCLEHTSMIWHLIQQAKSEKSNLHVVFLDLENAFGSVPHSNLWSAFDFFRVPASITNLVKAYFQDLQFCFSTPDFTTMWQSLEIGIMAGCTISPLAFTMAMEVILRASKWVVGGKRLKTGVKLTPIRAFMDDITTLTTTVPCTRRLLEKLQENISRARMKIKPSKSRSISITKGKLSDQRFFINSEPIPTISEKPIKSLGRCYDASLRDCSQVEQLKQDVARDLKKLDHSMLPGKLKLWCLQFGLLPRLLWPLTVIDIPITAVQKMERTVSAYVRKWLGVPKCLSSISLYGHGILDLPLSSLVEEFKCAKSRLELTLTESRDTTIRAVTPALTTGRKWTPKEAVQQAKSALQHAEIVGRVQQGRSGLGSTKVRPRWSKATAAER